MQIGAYTQADIPAPVTDPERGRRGRRSGFVQIGTLPGGIRMKDGTYRNDRRYYHTL